MEGGDVGRFPSVVLSGNNGNRLGSGKALEAILKLFNYALLLLN